MPQASIAIQMLPKVGEERVIPIVDAVINYIRSTGLPFMVAPFETTIEGDFDVIWDIAKRCHEICVEQGAPGLASYIKVYYNPTAGVWSIEEKTAKHK